MQMQIHLVTIASLSLLAFSSCSNTNPYTGQVQFSKTATAGAIGAATGALAGAVIGNNTGSGDSERGAVIGGVIGGLAGMGIGQYQDQQEAAIREQLRGTGVSVTRMGNDIVLNMPHDITFSVARTAIRPEFTGTLDSVALVLNKFNRTSITIDGHTDSDGSASYNQGLSEGRATSVANYLASRRVHPQRLITRGFGESQPIASNNTSSGKAQNRRVELRIVPQQGAF